MNPDNARLFDAVEANDTVAIREALHDHTRINARNEAGVTPLDVACRLGYREAVQVLLANGAQPDAHPLNARNGCPETQGGLSNAAARDFPGICRDLFRAGVKPGFRDGALSDAIGNDCFATVAVCLEYGADAFSPRNDVRVTPAINKAVKRDATEILRLMVSHYGFDPDDLPSYKHPLRQAVIHRREKALRALLAAKPDIEKRSAFDEAVSQGNTSVCSFLLDHGLDPNEKIASPKGANARRSLIGLAAQFDLPDLIDDLVSRGADVHARDSLNEPALYWAVAKGHEDTVDRLLVHGADVCDRASSGETLQNTALRRGRYAIAEKLQRWVEAGNRCRSETEHTHHPEMKPGPGTTPF